MRTLIGGLLRAAPVIGIALALPGAAAAATITVDTNTDAIDEESDCSLREAIIAANTNSEVDGCPAGDASLTDVIVLPSGTWTLTLEGSDEDWGEGPGGDEPYAAEDVPDATIGDLDITESVEITGAGSALTTIKWDAVTGDRIFQIAPPSSATAEVSLSGLSLEEGAVYSAVINPSDPEDEQWSLRRFGGAVVVGAGAGVKLAGTSGPSDEGGPSDEEEGGFGEASLTLDDVVFYANYAGGDGGGLFSSGDVSATEVWFEANTTGGNGGALYMEGIVDLSTIAFIDNTAEGGGAIFLSGPTSGDIVGATFAGNYAIGGGAVSLRSLVELNFVNATFYDNEAFDVGGALYSNGYAMLTNSTIVGNHAGGDADFGGGGINSFGGGEFELVNTLLSDNWSADVHANCGCTGGSCDPTDSITSQGYNLEDEDTCGLDATGDLAETEPLLYEYGSYGGYLPTIALTATSPAIDAGSEDACADADARGLARPEGSYCDIGSFELSELEVDQDGDGTCEGLPIGSETVCVDGTVPGDCDDDNGLRYPGNQEICSGIDDDCDGLVDDADDSVDLTGAPTWYLDRDGDGYGDVDLSLVACDLPAGYTSDDTDCDDVSAAVNPGETEICGGIDEDCDGLVDDDDDSLDLTDVPIWYVDLDQDGFGDTASGLPYCLQPFGRTAVGGDCEDRRADVNPDGQEVCGGIDEDCDGLVDDADDSVDLTGAPTWYADTDGDGYGDAEVGEVACEESDGWVADATDCNDSNGDVNPGEDEVYDNGIDDNCDGLSLETKEDGDDGEACGGCATPAGGATGAAGALAMALALFGLARRRED